MSKAFTKESDGEDDVERDLAADGDMPGGFTNYITPAGRRRLNDELTRLWKVDRPELVETIAWAASNGDRSENGDYIYGKRRLREIDRRIRFLRKRLEIAKVVDPAQQTTRDRVFFGARVSYANAEGVETTVRIVGIDEADFEQGQISWISPVARALLRARAGDNVQVRTPAGSETIEVIAISYDSG